MKYSELNIAEKLTKLLFSENFSVKSLGTHRSIHFNFKFINVSSNKEYGLYGPDSGGGRAFRRDGKRKTVNFLIIANWSTTSSIVKFKRGQHGHLFFRLLLLWNEQKKQRKKVPSKVSRKCLFYFIESESCIFIDVGATSTLFFLPFLGFYKVFHQIASFPFVWLWLGLR